ncbi:MAG: hypothetical protein ACRDT0_19795 [Pseudonocardiaceae bacterium]
MTAPVAGTWVMELSDADFRDCPVCGLPAIRWVMRPDAAWMDHGDGRRCPLESRTSVTGQR